MKFAEESLCFMIGRGINPRKSAHIRPIRVQKSLLAEDPKALLSGCRKPAEDL
jgi:hypothetical protein